MACNCKGKKIEDYSTNSGSVNIGSYILKTLAFILMLIALPIINIIIIWFMFRTIVLNKEVDIKPILTSLGKKFKEADNEEEDYDELTEEDVIMDNVEVLKK